MRNEHHWRPTKFEWHRGRLRASRDPKHVAVASRMIVDLVGQTYQQHLPDYCQGRLLDLGCGHVPLWLLYQNLIDENICVDWSGSFHQNEYLDISHDLSTPLPIDDNAFDTVICSDVMEHLPTPALTFGEIARVLKPGGNLILNVPFLYWIHEAPHDFHRYTEFALRRYCEQAGLDVVLLVPVGGSFLVAGDVLAKSLVGIRWFGKPVAKCLQAIARCAQRCSANRATFPLFYFIVARKR